MQRRSSSRRKDEGARGHDSRAELEGDDLTGALNARRSRTRGRAETLTPIGARWRPSCPAADGARADHQERASWSRRSIPGARDLRVGLAAAARRGRGRGARRHLHNLPRQAAPQVFNTVRRNDEIVQCDSCNRISISDRRSPTADSVTQPV